MEMSISHRVASLLLLTKVICELTISCISFPILALYWMSLAQQ